MNEFMGVSQLLGAGARAAPKFYAYGLRPFLSEGSNGVLVVAFIGPSESRPFRSAQWFRTTGLLSRGAKAYV